ncbi:MAG TPA: hypothetical protein VFR37_13210 [Longimicrobium sp.]|nr:hypothetical protein [Longimicrobium sp.]
MITDAQIERMIHEHPDRRFFIHNGFHGWSYGSPLNPVFITAESARALLDLVARRAEVDALQEVQKEFPPFQYAEEGDDLYKRTGRNRFIAFLDPEGCVYDPEHRRGAGEIRHLRL